MMNHPLRYVLVMSGVAVVAACSMSSLNPSSYAAAQADDSTRLNNIGLGYMQGGDAVHAEAYFQKALKVEPDLAITHLNLGLAYQQTGKIDLAKEQYQLAIQDDIVKGSMSPVPAKKDLNSISGIAEHKLAELSGIHLAADDGA